MADQDRNPGQKQSDGDSSDSFKAKPADKESGAMGGQKSPGRGSPGQSDKMDDSSSKSGSSGQGGHSAGKKDMKDMKDMKDDEDIERDNALGG